MDKVTMLIWAYRTDKELVKFVADFLAKYSNQKYVFDGIEFYLPQLAHMIIHLETSGSDWPDSTLERFALIISQNSLHFALQMHWILTGAIEDYRPETVDGLPNERFNAVFYRRCIKLRQNLERAVVYGAPRKRELQRMLQAGDISIEEYEVLELGDRKFNAHEILENKDLTCRSSSQTTTTTTTTIVDSSSAATPPAGTEVPSSCGTVEAVDEAAFQNQAIKLKQERCGWLQYKRRWRKKFYKRKLWKKRFFVIEDRMLYCYDGDPRDLVVLPRLRRAIPLEGARIVVCPIGVYEDEHGRHYNRHQYCFEVHNHLYKFKLRATNELEASIWSQILLEQSRSPSLFSQSQSSMEKTALVSALEPDQRSRYEFFVGQYKFVDDLCDVAEKLRFKDRDERKAELSGTMAEVHVPTCAYVPMKLSTDVWAKVLKLLGSESRVFSTKERCPILMYFLDQFDKDRLVVADYLHRQYDIKMAAITENDDDDYEEEEEDVNAEEEEKVNGKTNVDDGNGDSAEEGNEEIQIEASVNGGDVHSVSVSVTESKSKSNQKGPHVFKRMSSIFRRKSHVDVGDRSSKIENTNQMVRKLMKDMHLDELPKSIKDGLKKARAPSRKKSMLDKATLPIQSVKIVESHSVDSDLTDTLEHDDYGIDANSLTRAKKVVCGGESWKDRSARILASEREAMKNGKLKDDISISSVIVKSNDDVRQEVFVMQMIHYYQSVFSNAGLPIWLRPYRILSCSKTTGLIETLTDSTSIDGLKKADGYPEEGGLRAYFEQAYGDPSGDSFKAAQRNFMISLAGYSIVSYLLGLKDRHNGNIMIDIYGHLIFIDFGFAMGMAPGHEFSLERAPFKFTKDYLDVLGGVNSSCFSEFKDLFVNGFEAARNNSQIALGLVEIMMYKSNYPCFSGARYGGDKALRRFEKRLMLGVPDDKIKKRAEALVM